jgi:hypothetical protein
MVWVQTKSRFEDNLVQMPEIDEIFGVDIVVGGWRSWFNRKDQLIATVTPETPEWLRLFHYLASTMGELNRVSASRAFELLGDRAVWVKSNPGKHPALDCLIDSLSTGRRYDLKIRKKPEESLT